MLNALPRGSQPLYQAMREAGVRGAKALRNVPWISTADDGVAILKAWHKNIEDRNGLQVVSVRARSRKAPTKRAARKKGGDVTKQLALLHGQRIRVVVVEAPAKKGAGHSGARYDNEADWLVEDTGQEFLLWRGRVSLEANSATPLDPPGFGQINPARRLVVSEQIERLAKVRNFTLRRADFRCEIPGCVDFCDFEQMDIHHMTKLGQRGADHTDNTVALCPPCHSRVHRGTSQIRTAIEVKIRAIRDQRARQRPRQ